MNARSVGNAFRTVNTRAKKTVANLNLRRETRRQTAPVKRALDFVAEEMEKMKRNHNATQSFHKINGNTASAVMAEKIMEQIFRELRLKKNEQIELKSLCKDGETSQCSLELVKRFEQALQPYQDLVYFIAKKYGSDIFSNAMVNLVNEVNYFNEKRGE